MGTLLIDKLLQTVVTQKASDLHLTVGSKPMLRLGGHMVPLNTKVLESSDTAALMKSITPERCQQELQEVLQPLHLRRRHSRGNRGCPPGPPTSRCAGSLTQNEAQR